jgi:hypothetical protein
MHRIVLLLEMKVTVKIVPTVLAGSSTKRTYNEVNT